MKKIIILFFATTFSISVFSQGFGLKGGLNIANGTGADMPNNVSSKTGIYIGIFSHHGDGGIRWSPEITYQKKGVEFTVAGETGDYVSLNYIDIAINGQFHINDELALTGGPYIGYILNGKADIIYVDLNTGFTTKETNSISDWDNFNRVDFGGSFGIMYHLNDLLNIHVNYKIGFTSVLKGEWTDLETGITRNDPKVYNTAIQFGVGYLFNY